MAVAAAKVPFHSTRAKVFSNAKKDGEENDKIRVNPNVVLVREQLEERKKKFGSSKLREKVESAIDIDGKTFMEKYCRGEIFLSGAKT